MFRNHEGAGHMIFCPLAFLSIQNRGPRFYVSKAYKPLQDVVRPASSKNPTELQMIASSYLPLHRIDFLGFDASKGPSDHSIMDCSSSSRNSKAPMMMTSTSPSPTNYRVPRIWCFQYYWGQAHVDWFGLFEESTGLSICSFFLFFSYKQSTSSVMVPRIYRSWETCGSALALPWNCVELELMTSSLLRLYKIPDPNFDASNLSKHLQPATRSGPFERIRTDTHVIFALPSVPNWLETKPCRRFKNSYVCFGWVLWSSWAQNGFPMVIYESFWQRRRVYGSKRSIQESMFEGLFELTKHISNHHGIRNTFSTIWRRNSPSFW